MANNLPNQYGSQPLTVFPKASKRTVRKIVENVQLDALELAGDERLTEQAMEAVAHLDAVRFLKARSPEANALMFELESAFASRSARKIANRNSPLAGL